MKVPTGFDPYALPNIEWMLRMIIWADPEKKNDILNKQVEEKITSR